MKATPCKINQQVKKVRKYFFAFSFLSVIFLFIPSAQAVDLLFNGVQSSIVLSEPGGALESTVNLAVSAELQATDSDFFNSSCNITGRLLLTSSSASNTDDYRIDNDSFTIATDPTGVANGQTFTSDDNFLSILSDSQEESTETITISMRDVSIVCGQNNVSVRNTQVLNINIIDAQQQSGPVLDNRDALRAVGQSTLVSQVDDIKTFSLLSSATRTRGLIKQIHRSRQRTQTIDTSNLNVSLNGIPLDCSLLPALCHSNFNNANDSGTSSDNNVSPLGFFVNGSVELGERKDENNEDVDFDSDFFSIGVDYRINKNLILGTALSRSTTESGAQNRTSATDYEQYGLSVFSSYYFDSQYYIDFIASYGSSDYDLQRKVEIGTVTGFALGDTDGKETNMALSTGYSFSFDNMELRLSGVLNYTELSVDAYEERPSGAIPTVEVDQLDLEQFISNVAADFSWNINSVHGVFVPQISLGWEHHYTSDTFGVDGALSADATTTDFSYVSQVQDDDYLTWLVGISTVLPHGITAYATVEGYAERSDVKSNTAFVGVRLEF